jgi:CHAT domain-containing protein
MNKKSVFIFLIACLWGVAACQSTTVNRRAPSAATTNRQQPTDNSQQTTYNPQHTALALEQELSRLDPEKDTAAYLDILMRLTYIHQRIGRHQQALVNLHQVLPLIEKHPDHRRNALFFNAAADVYLSLGYRKQAAHYLERGIKEAQLANDLWTEASILNHVANMFAVRGDYENAITAYQKCLERIRTIPSATGGLKNFEIKVFINLIRAKLQKHGATEDISDNFNEAALQTQSLPDSPDKAENLLSLSRLLAEYPDMLKPSGRNSYQLKLLKKTLEIGEKLKSARISSYACGYMGERYEKERNYSEGMRMTRRAVFFAQQGNYPETLYLWQWQLGRIFSAAGDTEAAIRSYQDAIDTVNPIRAQLFRGYRNHKNIFDKRIKPVYLGLAALFLKQAEDIPDEEFREAKLRAARDTMERLKTAELQDFYNDECLAASKSGEAAEHPAPHTAVIYPIPLADHPVLLLDLPNGVKQVKLPVDSEELRETVRRFRNQLQYWEDDVEADARQLYEWLIEPIESDLTAQEIKTLIIAPDGALRLIPFAALLDQDRFLIEKYAIVTVPALTLIGGISQFAGDMSALMGGLSEEKSDGEWAFPPLPGVPKELASIESLVGGKKLLNRDYTTDNLIREFKAHEYTIMHIATHGIFGGASEETFLLTYDGRLTMDGLEKLISLGKFRKNKVDLLTLSACETAQGDERAAFGLAGIAVKAGVNSAIATLWPVDDRATFQLISEFYRQLKTPGISKAEALQNAQRTLIVRPRFWHPGFWSPFLLIGNWE